MACQPIKSNQITSQLKYVICTLQDNTVCKVLLSSVADPRSGGHNGPTMIPMVEPIFIKLMIGIYTLMYFKQYNIIIAYHLSTLEIPYYITFDEKI